VKFAVPTFCGFNANDLRELTIKAGLPEDLKFAIYNGKTGEPYAQKVAIGHMHVLKLVHMVEDKIHARSVGPYSLITQQPLGGKSRQ
jgi:DNA-directed RNA polymerase subunit beta